MEELRKTELVFGDLCQLYHEINTKRRNPKLFRLAFESYVFKSQQLTEAMRGEYKQKTGKKWNASNFGGWNEYTAAIKKIRNAALHGCPIILDEVMLSIYPNVEFFTDTDKQKRAIIYKKYRATISRCFGYDPFSEVFISAGTSYPLKEKVSDDPQSLGNFVFPIKEYVFYELCWDILDLGVLSDIGIDERTDAIKLVLKSFPRLEQYMQYYESELESNMYDAFKSDDWIKA